MKVEIQLEKSSEPILYENVINAYTKGDLYCILFKLGDERKTHKFPISNIFRVIEDYPESKREELPENIKNLMYGKTWLRPEMANMSMEELKKKFVELIKKQNMETSKAQDIGVYGNHCSYSKKYIKLDTFKEQIETRDKLIGAQMARIDRLEEAMTRSIEIMEFKGMPYTAKLMKFKAGM